MDGGRRRGGGDYQISRDRAHDLVIDTDLTAPFYRICVKPSYPLVRRAGGVSPLFLEITGSYQGLYRVPETGGLRPPLAGIHHLVNRDTGVSQGGVRSSGYIPGTRIQIERTHQGAGGLESVWVWEKLEHPQPKPQSHGKCFFQTQATGPIQRMKNQGGPLERL